MGGPAAGILLKRVPGIDELAGIRTWLGEIAEVYKGSEDLDIKQGWEFFVRWPLELGDERPRRACLGAVHLYVIDLEAASSGGQALTPDEWANYERALGWMPVAELSVSIFCNQPRDHKTLAWLCVQLADRLEGMVDLGGPVSLTDRDRSGLGGLLVEVSD